MTLEMYIKGLYHGFMTLYACQRCGGLCQIREDMKTVPGEVLTRLSGENEGCYSKHCPYCGEHTTFRKFLD
jgi:hypothetical protein